MTLGAFALRFVDLTRFELFVDEAATWWFARLTAGGHLAEQMSLEPTPPLYYALVGLLMKLFGESELVLRLPSAVFGAAAIPIIFALGRALFGHRAGWLAALILAIHPLHVFYSREARVYPLLLCLTMGALLALWQALENGSKRAWAVFGGLLILVCYSHFYGLFLAATAALAIVLLGRDWRARRRGLLATALAMLAFSPYLAMTFPHLEESGAAWSIDMFYYDYPKEQRLGRVLETQLIGADYHPYLRHLDQPETPLPLSVASVVAQLILLVLAVRSGISRRRLREVGFLLVTWLVPILVPWTITQLGRAIFHAGRHDFYALGSLCVLLAVGLEALIFRQSTEPVAPKARTRRRYSTRRWLRVAAAVSVVAALTSGAGFRLLSLHLAPAPSFHRAAGEWIAGYAEPQDRVVAMGVRRLATEYYARLAGSRVPFESFPGSTDAHPGWSDVLTLIDDEEALHAEGRGRIEALGLRAPGRGAVFLLLRSYRHTEGAVSATWVVDRHLLENLWNAGWRRQPNLTLAAARIEAYRPPEAPTSPEESSEP